MRRWMLLALFLPLVAWLLAKVADRMEAKRGESGLTHVMRMPHRWRAERHHRRRFPFRAA